jgi:nucleoid DNA-binding protein
MEELIKEMSGKLGISEETAEKGVHIVLEFIKKKLPPQMAEQVDSFVTSQSGTTSGFGSIADKLFGH